MKLSSPGRMISWAGRRKAGSTQPGDWVSFKGEDRISLEAVQTNLYDSRDILLNVNGHEIRAGEAKIIKDLLSASPSPCPVKVTKGSLNLGELWFTMKY